MGYDQRDADVRSQLKAIHTSAFGWALSCCEWERPIAEDVLQTSYLKVLEGKARFEGRSTFKTWFFEVIRRTAAGERRERFLRRFLPLDSVVRTLRSAERSPEDSLLESERETELVSALLQLPQRQREVLHLVFYGGLTIREAAQVVGISLGTARTHYERGKKGLKALLQEKGT